MRPCSSDSRCMKREHSIGASVRETSAETAIEAVTVSANSRNMRPMMPPMRKSGMNTATSDRLIESTVKPISREPASAALEGRSPILDVTIDVFHHHDGFVDDESHGDGERHHRQIVEAEVERIHCRR